MELWLLGTRGQRKSHHSLENETKQRVKDIRHQMTPKQAGMIVGEIIPTLKPVIGSKVVWIWDLGSGKQDMVVIPQQETLLLYDQMTKKDSELFRHLVHAVLCPSQRPFLSTVHLIALALLALGGTADEAAIHDWLLEHIAYFNNFNKQGLLERFTSNMRNWYIPDVLWNKRHKIDEEPVFVPESREGANERGLTWRLPWMNVDYIFKEFYGEKYVPFWDHPRSWSESQARTRSCGRTLQLMDLPPEIRGMIIKYIIPMCRILGVRTCHKSFEFKDLPCARNQNHHHCALSHFLPFKRVFKYFNIPDLGRDMRTDFFGTNTFVFEDMPAIAIPHALEGTYLAQSFLKHIGNASLGALRKIDLVLRIDMDWDNAHSKVSRWVLYLIGAKTQLNRLDLDIRCDGIDRALGPGAVEHPIFRTLRGLPPVWSLGIKLSEDIPGLEASLRKAIDLSFLKD